MNEKFPISLLVVIQYTIHRHKYRQIIIFFCISSKKLSFARKIELRLRSIKSNKYVLPLPPLVPYTQPLHELFLTVMDDIKKEEEDEWDRKVIECEVRGEGKVGYNDKYPSREREKEVVLLGSSSVSFLPFLYMHAKSYVVVFGKGVLLMWVQAPTDRVWAIV